MKFKTIEPQQEEIKNIVNIIYQKGSIDIMANKIIQLYSSEFENFKKSFSYKKYIDAKEEERKKWNFLPTDIFYVQANSIEQRTIDSIIQDINTNIIYRIINSQKSYK
jgi:hypothetical protein